MTTIFAFAMFAKMVAGTILDDFELLCLDGTRAHATEWKTCNLGKVPAHVIMTQGAKSQQEIQIFLDLLMYGQQYYSSKQGDRQVDLFI